MLMGSVSSLYGGTVGGTGSWAQGSTADAGPAGQTAAQPPMSAADVQQALLTTPDGAPQVSGIGQSGSGAWYSQMQPGMQGIDYNALMATAPGAYNNVYAPAMEQTLNQILGRQPFAYDVNADGLYQQIKDNYIKAGRQAMMDTQGQAAALTGGYGNSYAAQAGQQAYQESLGNLANAIPQLAQQAYAQYMDQGDQLRNNLEAMRLLEGQDYSRWLDDQERYQAFLKEMPSIMQSQAAASGRLGGGRIYSQMEPDISSYGPRTGTTGGGSSIGVSGQLDAGSYMAAIEAFGTGALSPEQVLSWAQQGVSIPGYDMNSMTEAALYTLSGGNYTGQNYTDSGTLRQGSRGRGGSGSGSGSLASAVLAWNDKNNK